MINLSNFILLQNTLDNSSKIIDINIINANVSIKYDSWCMCHANSLTPLLAFFESFIGFPASQARFKMLGVEADLIDQNCPKVSIKNMNVCFVNGPE